jgi:hypothetical protein
MKPKSISYSESKESVNDIGLKSWRKAGVEIELGDDSEMDGFAKAKDIVSMALAPQLFDYVDFSNGATEVKQSQFPITTTLTIINKEKERIEIAIDNCESLYELDLLMGDIAKHQLVPQYLEKKKSLK